MKEQTIGDFITSIADKEKFVRMFEYLNNHPKKGYRCDGCNLWYKADSIFPYDGELLCPRCLKKRRA